MDKETSFTRVVSHIREKGLSREEIIAFAQKFPATMYEVWQSF